MDPIIYDKLGQKILADLKAGLKDSWDSFSAEDKQLAADCALDAGKIAIRAAAGEDVAADKRQVDAQLANLKAAGTARVSTLLWAVVGSLFDKATRLLLGVI